MMDIHLHGESNIYLTLDCLVFSSVWLLLTLWIALQNICNCLISWNGDLSVHLWCTVYARREDCMLVWSVHQLFGALCCRYRLSHLSVYIFYHSHWWVLLCMFMFECWKCLHFIAFSNEHCLLKIHSTHAFHVVTYLCDSTVSHNLTDLATVRFLDGTNYSITNHMVPDKENILYWHFYVAKPNWLRVGYPWLLTW